MGGVQGHEITYLCISRTQLLGNVAHQTFYVFLKVGQRFNGLTVDHGLEVSSQQIAGRIQVGGCRKSSCRKLPSDDSVVTVMEEVHLLHTTGNMTCTVTGQRYVSLLELSVIAGLQVRRCGTTTVFMQYDVLLHTTPAQ